MSKRKNKIGVVTSTYAYFNFEDALASLAAGGFKYVEPITMPGFVEHIFPTEEGAERALNLCQKYGVELFCISGHGRLLQENTIAEFKQLINLAKLTGVNYITTDTGDIKEASEKSLFLDQIREIADYATADQVEIGIEIHGNWCVNGKIAAEIVKTVGRKNVKVTYDTGNTLFYGDTDPEEDIKHVLPLMGHLHLKDKVGGYKVWDFPALGEGQINLDKIIDEIKNYNLTISVEVELDGKENPYEDMSSAVKRSFNFLQTKGLV